MLARPDTLLPAAFLFDLDGVLVRTEELHQEGYRRACESFGRTLDWTFPRYCVAAHYGPERLQEELRVALPGLLEEVGWRALYEEKSRVYLELLAAGRAALQPGAAAVLSRLARRGTPRAIVTNSTREQTELLRRQIPRLASVDQWVTREDYEKAKPAPDCYALALERLGVEPAEALGFEDTPRGLQALGAAGVRAVLVTRIRYPDLGPTAPVLQVPDLAALPHGWAP